MPIDDLRSEAIDFGGLGDIKRRRLGPDAERREFGDAGGGAIRLQLGNDDRGAGLAQRAGAGRAAAAAQPNLGSSCR